MNCGGFTLLELLATTVLLGLVVGAVSLRWASSAEAARTQGAIATLRDLDSRARSFGRGGAPVVLRAESEGTRARLLHALSGELLASVALPEGVTASILVPELRRREVLFDRTGRSPSYCVELRAKNGERKWTVSGATGWVTEAPP